MSRIMRNPEHVFQYHTEPQTNLEGRPRFWPRGKPRIPFNCPDSKAPCSKTPGRMYPTFHTFLLPEQLTSHPGSNINAMMAQFGSPGDFDEWASILSDPSWAFSSFKHYFHKMETYGSPAYYPGIDPEKRGTNGPMQIGYRGHISEVSKSFLEACNNAGIAQSKDFVWESLGFGRVSIFASCSVAG